MIANGKRTPPRSLAIHIFRVTGWRHPAIADLTDEQIITLEAIEPWARREPTPTPSEPSAQEAA
jgi:hypothetical protein